MTRWIWVAGVSGGRRRALSVVAPVTLVLLAVGCSEVSEAPDPRVRGDWPMYRGDLAGTGYLPLDEITPGNVSNVSRVWTYSLRQDSRSNPGASSEAGGGPNSQATPVVIDGTMYLPAADRVVALDPQTGLELWRHTLAEGAPSRRGVAYWPGDDRTGPRVIFTSGRRLVALDAATGDLATEFGQTGEIDMVVPYNSVPLVQRNIVVVGANTPRGAIGGIGNARAFDARTGAKLWEFSSVPQPGAVGHESWEGDSWRDRLGVNAWPFYFTMDAERGLLYLPLASPVPGAWGGDRRGANLFGNSVVAVDIETGEYRWHFQTIHHDLWDADPPAPPALFDIELDGTLVPALGVTTKSGYLYILNRETGDPVFGVEERPVPASDAPGELASPTQPFPIKPPPLARVSYVPDDLVTADDTTAEHAMACAELVEVQGEIVNGGPFTPWVYREPGSVPRTTLLFPGLVGGPNWGGAAFDPNTGFLFAFSQDIGSFGWLEDADDDSPVPYRRVGPRPNSFDVDVGGMRLPCQKPPWGQLTAVDTSTGDVAWQRPLGITEQLPDDRQHTGRPGRAGAIVTGSGVLFVASTDDNRFRALDAATGRELWVDRLEQRGNANPMTYQAGDGRQYVAVSATDEVVAYALP